METERPPKGFLRITRNAEGRMEVICDSPERDEQFTKLVRRLNMQIIYSDDGTTTAPPPSQPRNG